jgi:hypothetical protein
MTFDAFVGVDWSGAKGSRHRGIQVAVCSPGQGAPRVVAPQNGAWARCALLDWTLETLGKGRVLIGFDFSFTLPYIDRGAYFPGSRHAPRRAQDLWRLVDRGSADGADFYAGGFVEAVPFATHFRTPRQTGARFSRRHKVVERACVEQGLGAPESVFHLIGPKQVGLGSLAGMRFLLALKSAAPTVRVWPFDPVRSDVSVVVEVFPRAFLTAAGQAQTKARSAKALNAALRTYGSRPMNIRGAVDDNIADAAVTAAGLRAWSGDPGLWRPTAMDASVRRTEGWIFGVR